MLMQADSLYCSLPTDWLHQHEASDAVHGRPPASRHTGLAVGGGQQLLGASSQARLAHERHSNTTTATNNDAHLLQVHDSP